MISKHMNNTIACFGEMMLRFSPDTDGQWLNNSRVPVYIGGAELNCASALAAWKQPVKYITALPESTVAEQLQRSVRARGVELFVHQVPASRIGVYYLTQGAELKGAGVTYDRDRSAFAQLQPGMIDWDAALEGCSWLHFSAINPALNANLPLVCEEGLKAAKQKGLTISVDLNYRPKLWQYGKKPASVMPVLVQYADLIMGNIWAVEALLGIPSGIPSSENKTTEELVAAAIANADAVAKAYPAARKIVYTFRLSDRYFSVAKEESQSAVSKLVPVSGVVDRAGSGDCFMGGLIYGTLNGLTLQQQLDLASCAAVAKMKEAGDHTRTAIQELEAIAFGNQNNK